MLGFFSMYIQISCYCNFTTYGFVFIDYSVLSLFEEIKYDFAHTILFVSTTDLHN